MGCFRDALEIFVIILHEAGEMGHLVSATWLAGTIFISSDWWQEEFQKPNSLAVCTNFVQVESVSQSWEKGGEGQTQ